MINTLVNNGKGDICSKIFQCVVVSVVGKGGGGNGLRTRGVIGIKHGDKG